MILKLKINQYYKIVLVTLCLVIPCNVATLFEYLTEPLSRTSGSVLYNMFGEKRYKHHVITSHLDVNDITVGIKRLVQNSARFISGNTGERNTGTYLQRSLHPLTPFPCRRAGQRSANVPTSVHQLRPGDIDIVAAMGDSITVSTGANALNPLEILVENRGLSFSIGGYKNFRTHLTIPNILKEFNPQLFGYSLGDYFNYERGAQFNVAENGAGISDMPFMAYKLIQRMRLDRRVNMPFHWKLLTIMIGGNDYCSEICHHVGGPMWMLREQEENIIATLRIIRDNMPRTFVNLVTEPLVSLVLSMDRLNIFPGGCYVGRMLACGCLEGPAFSQQRNLYIAIEQRYRTLFDRIAHRAEFQRDDFAVVFQPFGVNASVYVNNRIPDTSIMAYDCIHWSQKGDAVAANALWNNMMQPEWNKTTGFKPLFQEFLCPTDENPYLRTYFN